MKRSRTLLTVAAVVAGTALAAPVTASAAPTPSDPIVTGLAGPLQMDLGHKGQIYVAQDFAGILTKVRANGSTKDIVTEQGEIAGVASDGYDVVYTFTGGTEENPVALLKERRADGRIRTIADIGAYEAEHNPDAFVEYGFRNLKPSCAAQVPPEIGGEPYNGIVESHPFSVVNDPNGGWYVADAAANDIIHVAPNGDIETVIVPRPIKSSFDAETAELYGLPDCVVGEVYAFEPVPTDLEINPNGFVIFSLLPGGPEDASLGARGTIMRVSPGDFEWTILSDGFLGATNVAVAPGGRVYVSELFGNKVSLYRNHTVTTVAEVDEPGALEFRDGKLYVATGVLSGPGSIVTIKV